LGENKSELKGIVLVWLLIGGQSLISSAGVLVLRHFMPLFLQKGFSSELSIWAGTLFGIFLYGTSFLAWLFILSRYQVSFAYPVTVGLTLALTVGGAVLLLKETITPIQLLGIFLLVIAIFLISTNTNSSIA
jgi:drug/metabolite transporter (DMT)-like permease